MTRRTTIWALLSMAFCALSLTAHAQDGVLLQYKFTPNELLRYNVSMAADITVQMNIPGVEQIPGIPVSMQGVMRQRTKRVLENGDAEIAVAFESLKMEASGTQIPIDVKTMPVITMVMSPSGQVKSSQGLEKMSAAFGGMPFADMGSLAQNSAFPQRPLNIGDTWTQDVPFPMGGKLQIQAQLAVAESGVAGIQQAMSGNINISSPMAGDAQGQMANSRGNILMNCNVYFSTERGVMLRSEGIGRMELALTAADTPGDMKAVVDMTVVMELLPE